MKKFLRLILAMNFVFMVIASRVKINFGINIPPVILPIPTFHFPPIKLTAVIHPPHKHPHSHHHITLPAITFRAQSHPHESDHVHEEQSKSSENNDQQSTEANNGSDDADFDYQNVPKPNYQDNQQNQPANNNNQQVSKNNQPGNVIPQDPYSYFYPPIPSNHQPNSHANWPIGHPVNSQTSTTKSPHYVDPSYNQQYNNPKINYNGPYNGYTNYQSMPPQHSMPVNSPQRMPYGVPNLYSQYPDYYDQIYKNYAPKANTYTSSIVPPYMARPNIGLNYASQQTMPPLSSSYGPGHLQYQNQQNSVNSVMSSIIRGKMQPTTYGPAASPQMKKLLDSHSKDSKKKSHASAVYQLFQSMLTTTPAPSINKQ